MIYLFVNIILDDDEKTLHNIFTIFANIQGVLWNKSSETLNKIFEKYLWKSSLLSKAAGSKKEFIYG